MPPTPEQQNPVPPVVPASLPTAPSAAIKAIRIFLLILIIVGLGLIATETLWVPKLVDIILRNTNGLTQQPNLALVTTCDSNPEHKFCTKDSSNVYIQGQKLTDADPTTFVVLNDNYAKDKNTFYSICIGEECDFGPVPMIDAKTYHFLPGSGAYAEDANRYYWGDAPLVGIATSSFVVLNDSFAKDAQHVYYTNQVEQGADVKSFVPIDECYAKDSSSVFNRYFKLPGVDPNTFSVVAESNCFGYYKDAKNVYLLTVDSNNTVIGADPNTFVLLGKWGSSYTTYAEDKNWVYVDNNGVISQINEADLATFTVDVPPGGTFDAQDKNHKYMSGKVVE